MKSRSPLLVAVLAALVFSTAGFAQEASAEPSSATAPTQAQVDLDALIETIGTKLRAGEQSAASLADELKQFDVLLAKYAGQRTDEVARIALMKAMLFLQIFEDFDEGALQLRKIVADFPSTEIATEVSGLLVELEPMIAAKKLKARLRPGADFPTFSELDMNGKTLDLAAYRGKVVLVDFWATWCGPCVAELPHVIAAYEKFHAKGFEIVGVSLDKDRGRLEAFLKENNMTWVQHFDGQGWNNKISKSLGIDSIPATFLLDQNGRIVATDLRGDVLATEIAKLLP